MSRRPHIKSNEVIPPRWTDALRFWLKLGCVSFGGTAAHIALMHETLVERTGWIGNEEFFRALSHCMLLPGPEAHQLAIYLGWKLHGTRGGIVAGTLFVLPSMIVLLLLSMVYARFGSMPWMTAIFSGLRPGVLAVVLLAVVRVVRRSLVMPQQWVVAALAFAGMAWLHLSIPSLMLATVAIGLVLARLSPGPQPSASVRAIDGASKTGAVWSPMLLVAAKMIATGFAIWLIPLAALLLWSHERGFWTSLSFFFTRTACVTFGGSYTVIPYVAHAAVGKYHWLAHTEMLDGFSLAESTPGPLIIVVAYVGFMAAFHHFHGSIAMGTVGLAVATFCTFLPCFVFVLAGAPFAEVSADSQTVKRILQLVTAVVLAAMLDLAVFLGRGVLFVTGASRVVTLDWIAAAWLVCVIVMLMKYRSSLGVVFSLSAGLGIARWWLHV